MPYFQALPGGSTMRPVTPARSSCAVQGRPMVPPHPRSQMPPVFQPSAPSQSMPVSHAVAPSAMLPAPPLQPFLLPTFAAAASKQPPKRQIASNSGSDAESEEELPAKQENATSLTRGLPTPDQVQRQKQAYAKSLEEQLKRGVEMLGANHKKLLEQVHSDANQKKHEFNLLQDQQVKQQEMVLSQEYNQRLMMLQQAAQQQGAELEQQAAHLTLEWEQRKTQEEFMVEQRSIQKRLQEAQRELQQEMQNVQPALGPVGLHAFAAATAAPPAVAGMLQYVPPSGGQAPLAHMPPMPRTLSSASHSSSRPGSYVPPVLPPAIVPVAPATVVVPGLTPRGPCGAPVVISRTSSYVPASVPGTPGNSFVPPVLGMANGGAVVNGGARLSQVARVASYRQGDRAPRASTAVVANYVLPTAQLP